MKTKKAILFDLFGTLFIYSDEKTAWDQWISFLWKNMSDFGLRLDKKEFEAHFADYFNIRIDTDLAHKKQLTRHEKRLVQTCRTLAVSMPLDEIKKMAIGSLRAWTSDFTLENGTADLLYSLGQTRKIALVSNFDHAPFVHELLAENGLHNCFDVITVSGEIDIDKPDPRIFRHTLGLLGMEPAQVVHIGDEPEADIKGAEAAGITPVLIDRTGTQTSVCGCALIKSLFELETLDLKDIYSSWR
ncbi:MAG: HAD family hydrolase [Spirochaetales bacterium]|nr:HAD family hydrolase [Spirochaetales bacterium]